MFKGGVLSAREQVLRLKKAPQDAELRLAQLVESEVFNLCIMAVDAEPGSLQDLREKLILSFPKQTVAAFSNPLEALKFADQNKIDMLFTDVRLRPIDGYELIKAMRQKQSFYAFVISGSKEHPDDLRWMNVNGCFAKPITAEELMKIRSSIA